MKILLVIDHCGLGGAQRQAVELACGLKERGHDSELFVYFAQHDYFRARLEAAQIPVHVASSSGGFSLRVMRALRERIRSGRYDLVLSYLNSPNAYAELAVAGMRGPKLVVSERCSHHDDRPLWRANLRRLLHGFADHVVTNSHTHAQWLNERWWLKDKASSIYNGVDLETLHPASAVPAPPIKLLAIGRVCEQKNTKNLIAALDILQRAQGDVPEIGWVGRPDSSATGGRYAREVESLLESLPAVRARWRWLGERRDVPALLREYHALIHPSFYEGLPNAVCEALASGLPVLVSNVCDHPMLVAEGQRGFLFDPHDPVAMANAIGRFAQLDQSQRQRLSIDSRRYAEENLTVDAMVSAYEKLFATLLHGPAPAARADRPAS